MNASRTVRERARADLVAEIVAAARRQLATTGAAALSMRAVSRELGMVSSALHRYFPTRDDLLTALIVRGYDDLADAVERAAPDGWLALARAVRGWALANPHEYALVYGSPVPGYHAPAGTVASAVRVVRPLVRLLADEHAAGRLVAGSPSPDADRLREALGSPDLPDDALFAAVTAWAGLLGQVSFELFGQLDNVVTDREAVFDASAARLGRLAGLDV